MNKAKSIPLYQTIKQDISNIITSDEIDYSKPVCTEKSICERYGVSRITAKRALSELESEGAVYRKRGIGSFAVKPSADEPLQDGRVNGKSSFKVFALLMPLVNTKGGMFRAIESAGSIFTRNKCQLSFHISELNVRRERELLEQLYSQDVDGIMYYPWTSTVPLEILGKFVGQNKPVVILDKACNDERISSVVCDNYLGGHMLASHLVSYGHQNTCFLSRFSPDDLSSVHDRYQGYADCLAKAGCTPRFIHLDIGESDQYPLLKHMVNTLHLEGVTAILCENDEVAFNVYMCCRSLNIRVPDDMNIAGFDNTDWATTGSAQITTVDQNFAQIGRTMANVMLQSRYTPGRHIIPIKLVPRTSTGKRATT